MRHFKINHSDGLYLELLHDDGANQEYDCSFHDRRTGELIYETKLKPNTWAKLTRKYLSDISLTVKYEDTVLEQINLIDIIKGNRVYIYIDSSALGDSIAWVPYCLKFKQVYSCDVIVTTFHNELFEDVYPELTFIKPNEVAENVFAKFKIGVFWDSNFESVNPNTVPMQQIPCNILCLDYEELEPRIKFTPKKRPYPEKYICISTRSTAQCKHWYYWNELVLELKKLNYRVIETSLHAQNYGAEQPNDKSLTNTMNILHHAELFIGLSSGISWLNWAIKKNSIMISNFTEPFYEFQSRCIRITNKKVCHGCWNKPETIFDRTNVNWCPKHENTSRQFECHIYISVEDVLSRVYKALRKKSPEPSSKTSPERLSNIVLQEK